MKTETCKLYSRDFGIFLPKIIKIDLYNAELYCFKVGAFFETQCSFFPISPLFELSLCLEATLQNFWITSAPQKMEG